MTTQKANNNNPYNNNGGSVFGFGRQKTGSTVDVLSPQAKSAAPPPAAQANRSSKARSAGAFSYSSNRPIARRHSKTVGVYQSYTNPPSTSGIPSQALLSAGSDFGQRKHFATFDVTFKTYKVGTALRSSSGTWHPISGAFLLPVENADTTFLADSGVWTRNYQGRTYHMGNNGNVDLSAFLRRKLNG